MGEDRQHDRATVLKFKDGTGTVCLEALFPYTKPQDSVNILKNHFFPYASKIQITESLTTKLQHCLESCMVNLKEKPIAGLLVEVLRALRWCATDDTSALNLTNSNLVSVLDSLIIEAVDQDLLVKIAIQVLLNLLSGCNEVSKKARRAKIRADIIINNYLNLSHCYEVSALLYNIYLDVDIDCLEVVDYVLKHNTSSANEYLEMLMGRMVQCGFFWHNFVKLPSGYKVDILKFCLDDQLQLPEECIKCLADQVILSGNVVFQVSKDMSSLVEEVALTLQLLAHLSGEEESLSHISGNKDLLINTGVLLINAHRLGQTDSVFKPVQKIAELHNQGNLRSNPVFGFKADLIKLIGNLSWKNKSMQDLVREAELIPVLLDCCNVDANNPFIMQWAIFAIRNVCEGNFDNQRIIAGMTRKEFVTSEILQEFGLTLHASEDGSTSGLVLLERKI